MRQRYTVVKVDECGTLEDCPRDMTWSVCDTTQLGAEGYPKEVSNHDTRAQARRAAFIENAAGALVRDALAAHCPGCFAPAHAGETDDLGRCASCAAAAGEPHAEVA